MTTVCRALADDINKDAAPQDKITPGAIRNRVQAKELGRDKSLSAHSEQISDESEPEQEEQPEMQQAAEKPAAGPHLLQWR